MEDEVWNSTKNKEGSRRGLAKRMTRSDVVLLVVLVVVVQGFSCRQSLLTWGLPSPSPSNHPRRLGSLAYPYR
jgi:hypothetical protein